MRFFQLTVSRLTIGLQPHNGNSRNGGIVRIACVAAYYGGYDEVEVALESLLHELDKAQFYHTESTSRGLRTIIIPWGGFGTAEVVVESRPAEGWVEVATYGMSTGLPLPILRWLERTLTTDPPLDGVLYGLELTFEAHERPIEAEFLMLTAMCREDLPGRAVSIKRPDTVELATLQFVVEPMYFGLSESAMQLVLSWIRRIQTEVIH